MRGACDTRFPRLVDRAFVRGLPARQRRQLREHIETCDACRQRWDRLGAVDRRMGGPQLSDAMIADIGGRVIASRPRRLWWVAGGIGALAGAALLLIVVRTDRPDSTFSSRGTPGTGRIPGVRLFCVAGDADHVRAEVRMVSSGPIPELRCTIDDDLQLAYTTPQKEGLTMVAFARLASTTIQYAPRSSEGRAFELRADRIDELVDWSTRLAAEHHAGSYDVIVRVFDRDVPARDAIDARVTPVVELHARLAIAPAGGVDDAR